jgi:glycosyltransferase involved in cell wall biosynthesis
MKERIVALVLAWNEEASLPALLAELARDCPDWTIVVVSDGSTDGSDGIVKRNCDTDFLTAVNRILTTFDCSNDARSADSRWKDSTLSCSNIRLPQCLSQTSRL